ncbi:MAG: peptidase M28, partial [Bradyrhizobium sp.]|nr:peptidase M28 [Bradyrhizobium sp.]
LDRSVKLAWWPGHSTGRYAGSTWFTDRFAIELDEHCVAQINCDSPGCRWATSFHETRAFTESAALATDAIRDIVPAAEIRTMRPPQAGDYSFNNIGLPSLFMLSSTMPEALRREKNYYDVSGCGANIAWHTENDTIEIADRDILLTDMRIYLLATLRIVNAELLPFDWGATCDEFLATIARYEKASEGADLSAARGATTALKEALASLQRSGAPAARKNAVLKQLSRLLVPINYTREPRFRHDPAYTVPPLPTLAVAAELPLMSPELRRFAEVELMRGQNRYVAAIRAATVLVQGALQ